MKDLDFDELDQAVSSVLNTKDEPKKEAPVDNSAVPVEKTDDKSSEVKVEDSEAKKDEKGETPTPSVTPTVSPAVRRRGQFLDMVHPSADMTSRLPVTSPAARKQLAPVSADAANLKPTAATTPAEVTKVEDDSVVKEDAPATVPEVPKTPAAEAADEAPEAPAKPADDIKWPDPLEISNATEATDENAKADEPDETPAAEAEPTGTPFVPDVKVDKRPLGGTAIQPSDEAASELSKLAETPAAVPAPTDATMSSPVPTEEPKVPESTPPELQPDVVSVEAAANREFAPDGKDIETDSDTNKGMAQSIPQQYHTPSEKPDNATHPVFDTDEYHQPLLPAHSKKKRGWLIVVIILGLLVVGAALGYFAFMAGL